MQYLVQCGTGHIPNEVKGFLHDTVNTLKDKSSMDIDKLYSRLADWLVYQASALADKRFIREHGLLYRNQPIGSRYRISVSVWVYEKRYPDTRLTVQEKVLEARKSLG